MNDPVSSFAVNDFAFNFASCSEFFSHRNREAESAALS